MGVCVCVRARACVRACVCEGVGGFGLTHFLNTAYVRRMNTAGTFHRKNQIKTSM